MKLKNSARYGSELAIAALIVAIVGLMILPLPTPLIDGLLAINISLSVILLMTTMYIPNAISLTSFPSLLLFTTLLRLSLNIASTKSILLHANAGHIIESFGKSVVGGNLVVGMVIFLIITTVQFIVIAKGSERVAEVGARFTLDAMPGKQMSIDADLRAGNISAEEARRRRTHLALESELRGGMDGAMKFVKGDAIAGLVITLVNIVAGIIIGITYQNMTAAEAANRFAILSIGDAMVSQISSLLICVSAGIMITRASNEKKDQNGKSSSSLGQEIGQQLTNNHQALAASSGLLACFALVPGFPSVLFLILSGTIAASSYTIQKIRKERKQPLAAAPSGKGRGMNAGMTSIGDYSPDFTSPLSVRLAQNLVQTLQIPLLNTAIEQHRITISTELGLPFPGITMWRAQHLSDNAFEVLVHDVPVYQGVLDSSSLKREIELTQHATKPLREKAHLFLGFQETQWFLDQVSAEYPGLIAEVQKAVPLQRIGDVLRRLLEERVPIRNAKQILESMIIWGPREKDPVMLTEYIRVDLGAFLAYMASEKKNQLPAIFLDHSVEQTIRQAIKPTPAGNYLTLMPEDAATLTEQIIRFSGEEARQPLALITSMDIRRYVRRMIEVRIPWLPVYSYQELSGHIELTPVGRVE